MRILSGSDKTTLTKRYIKKKRYKVVTKSKIVFSFKWLLN